MKKILWQNRIEYCVNRKRLVDARLSLGFQVLNTTTYSSRVLIYATHIPEKMLLPSVPFFSTSLTDGSTSNNVGSEFDLLYQGNGKIN